MRVFYMFMICGYAASLAEAVEQPKIKRLDPISMVHLGSVSLNPTSVIGGAIVTGTVTLQQAASSSVTVNIKSSATTIAAVPANVVVQPGATTAIFVVQTYPVTVNPNVVADPPFALISAQSGAGMPVTAKLSVLPPTLASFAFNPANVPGGGATTGQISITGPAPPGGLVITLSLSNASPVSVRLGSEAAVVVGSPSPASIISLPAQVTIPAGAANASFTVTTKAAAAPTPIEISATYGAYVKKTATLTVQPPSVASISFSPDHAIGGAAFTGTVTLTAPAPSSGMTVQFSFDDSSYICGPRPVTPASVQFPAGSTSMTFPLTTSPGYGIYYMSAGAASGHFLVSEPVISQGSLVLPSSVKGGTIVPAKLQLMGAAMQANCGNQYQLSSSNTLFAQVPPSVTVAPGTSEATFSVTTTAVGSNQTVTISVTSNLGYDTGSFRRVVNVPLTLTP